MNSQNEILSSLYKIPYFKKVGEEELLKLASLVRKRCFKKNELIFSADQKCQSLHILHKGKIKIYMVSENGKELIIHFLRPMNFFGEEILFGENIYEANAQALCETILFDINKKDLENFIISHPRVGIAMLASFGERVKKLLKMVGDLALKDIHSRLVCWLVQMAKEQGVRTNEGIEINGLSQEELASHLGTVREPVSRCLNRLQEADLIKLGRKKIVIPNLDYLDNLLKHIPSHIPTRHHS